jgi:glycosyltransferase involved in cell wall biosynthesis
VLDRDYFDDQVRPWLGNGIDYVGHLRTDDLVELVGSSSVSLVTPCWEEPYGLVVAESLACGTPVAGFARGALPELVTAATGRLVAAGDVQALSQAMVEATQLDRSDARRRAVTTCSLDAMITGYEHLYAGCVDERAA